MLTLEETDSQNTTEILDNLGFNDPYCRMISLALKIIKYK